MEAIDINYTTISNNQTNKTNANTPNINNITKIENFQCDKCFKTFNKLKNLKRHQSLHTAEKNFKCNICPKQYSRSDHLKRHLKSHMADKKPYHCDKCTQRFSNKSHLNRHVKNMHENILKYTCEVCDMKFHKKDKLNKHQFLEHNSDENDSNIIRMMSNSNITTSTNATIATNTTTTTSTLKFVRKYPCYYPFCRRKFFTKGRLDKHISKFHDCKDSINQKSLVKCPFEDCESVYTRMSNLRVHIKSKHYNCEEFKCEECDKMFRHKSSLNRHVLKYHKEKLGGSLNFSGDTTMISNLSNKDSISTSGSSLNYDTLMTC